MISANRKFSVKKPTIDRMNHSSEIKSTDRHRQSVFTYVIACCYILGGI